MTKPHERYGPAGTYRFWSTWGSEEDDAEPRGRSRSAIGATVPPAAGRHALGWRFATCSDAEPRWTCPGCLGEEGKAAAHDRAWGPPA